MNAVLGEVRQRLNKIGLIVYNAREKTMENSPIESYLVEIGMVVEEIRELGSKLNSLKAKGE